MSALRQFKDKIVNYVTHQQPTNGYRFVLTPAELDTSKSPIIMQYKEQKWISSTKQNTGIAQLLKDLNRDVKLNGKKIEKQNVTSVPTLKEFLLSEFKTEANSKELDLHFSQELSSVAVNTFVGSLIMDSKGSAKSSQSIEELAKIAEDEAYKPMIVRPDNNEQGYVSNVFIQNGEIYYKQIVERFPVKRGSPESDEFKTIGFIAGPMEILFKLESGKGFVLQHISTNSSIQRDIIMGKAVAVNDIVSAAENYTRGLEKINKALEVRENEIKKWLTKHNVSVSTNIEDLKPHEKSKRQNLQRINTAQGIIKQYKSGEKSIEEAHSFLSDLLKDSFTPQNFGRIGRFFPQVSTTTRVLRYVLADFEKTTGYKPIVQTAKPQEQAEVHKAPGIR